KGRAQTSTTGPGPSPWPGLCSGWDGHWWGGGGCDDPTRTSADGSRASLLDLWAGVGCVGLGSIPNERQDQNCPRRQHRQMASDYSRDWDGSRRNELSFVSGILESRL